MLLVALPAAAEGGAATAGADALFREAVQLGEAGKFAEAAEKFRASYQLDPARGTLQGWAMAEERAGDLGSAYRHYQRLARESAAAKDERRLDLAKKRMSVLAPKLALVTLEAAGPAESGVTLTIDGSALADSDIRDSIPAAPGDHVIRGSSASGATFEVRVTAVMGENVRKQVTWQAADLPPPVVEAPTQSTAPTQTSPQADRGSSSPLGTIGLIVGGVGLVAAGVGTYFWIDSGKDFDSVSDDCPNRQCPPEVQSQIDDGRTKESLAQMLLIGGGVAVAAGVTLFVVGSGQENQAQARAVVGPTGAYLTGRF